MKTRTIVQLVIMLIAVGAVVFLLSIVPKASQVELEVAASQFSFEIPAIENEFDENVQIPLLQTALTTNQLSLEGFNAFELALSPLENDLRFNQDYQRVRFEAINEESKVIFEGNEWTTASIQEISSIPDQQISIFHDDAILRYTINANGTSKVKAYVRLSLHDSLTLRCHHCEATLPDGSNIANQFAVAKEIRLHRVSQAIEVSSASERFRIGFQLNSEEAQEKAEIMYGLLLADLDFSRDFFSGPLLNQRSTIERIAINSAFSEEAKPLVARSTDDIKIHADPPLLNARSLYIQDNLLVLVAGNKLKKLDVVQGDLVHKRVPSWIAVLAQNQHIAITIACITFLLTIIYPLVKK